MKRANEFVREFAIIAALSVVFRYVTPGFALAVAAVVVYFAWAW
jgi:hypothetical protein